MAVELHRNEVEIINLRGRSELNGCHGTVIARHSADRVVVELHSNSIVKPRMALRESNIMPSLVQWDATAHQQDSFFKNWIQQIAVNDPGFRRVGADEFSEVYNYLAWKLFEMLNTVKKVGCNGWTFWNAGPSKCIPCVVWSDGSHSQSTEFTGGTEFTGSNGECWWPCLTFWEPGELVPWILHFWCHWAFFDPEMYSESYLTNVFSDYEPLI